MVKNTETTKSGNEIYYVQVQIGDRRRGGRGRGGGGEGGGGEGREEGGTGGGVLQSIHCKAEQRGFRFTSPPLSTLYSHT